MNPDKLRRNPKVLQFVKQIFDAGKPIAAICHGPWTLIDAGLVKRPENDELRIDSVRPQKRRRDLV